jgi:uncharacterized caspase-like protein
MKSLFSVLVILSFTTAIVIGQSTREEARKLKNPKDCGVSQYDDFKNSSFKLLSELINTDSNYEGLKTDIAGYKNGGKAITIDAVKGDISKFKKLKKSLETMDERVVALTNDGNDLLKEAKNVKPVTKVKAATDNTKKSLKAVDYSKKMIDELAGQVSSDIEYLSEQLSDLEGNQ